MDYNQNLIKKVYFEPFKAFRLPQDTTKQQLLNKVLCPKCKTGIVKRKNESVYYGFCNVCPGKSGYYCFWIPQPHQEAVLKISSTWLYNFGAMGTGKTEAGMYKAFQHMIEIDGAYIIVISHDLKTAKDNVKDILFKFLPREWIKVHEEQGKKEITQERIVLFNNSSLNIFSSQNPESYRGRNATMCYALEANKIKRKVVEELIGRLRNTNKTVFAKDEDGNYIEEIDENGFSRRKVLYDFGQIIVESNPDSTSWVFKDGLLSSSVIYYSYNTRGVESYKQFQTRKYPNRTAVVSATIDNKYQLEKYISDGLQTSETNVRKNIYGEFVVEGALVWPTISEREVKNKPHDIDWPHLFSGDWGTTNDPTAGIFLFIDPFREKLVVFMGRKWVRKSIMTVGYDLQYEFGTKNYLPDKKVFDSAITHKQADYWIDGGKSIIEQLNNPRTHNLQLTPANKKIKEGEVAVANLIEEEMIEFDTAGDGVLEILEVLRKAHYPTLTDDTKVGVRKDTARPFAENEFYDCIRYIAMSCPAQWIRDISKQYVLKLKRRDFQLNPTIKSEERDVLIARNALDLNKNNEFVSNRLINSTPLSFGDIERYTDDDDW